MIPRYCRPEMARLWTDRHKFQTWLRVELAVCEARYRRGEIPETDWHQIRKKARFSVKRVRQIEEDVRHDVIAFLTAVAENVGPASRHIHVGMTSSDVLDTALALNLVQASTLLRSGIERLQTAIARQARKHKYTACMGRSHGVHAEPTTFGLKLAVWYDELRRAQQRLADATEQVAVGKISGAVGTFAHIDPFVEKYVCEKLGLKPAPASTQTVQRDRHAQFLTTLAVIAASLEKFATEIRNLQRTEILEVEEFFSKGQKGSSAMPHKRNPITCERVAGLARVVRADALAALENVALWHERDITHSSVERVILPDATIALDYMLVQFTRIVDRLLVYPENMKKNLEKTGGLVFSQSLLLELARAGLTREAAYALVQKHAMAAWEGKADFRAGIESDAEIVAALGKEKIAACFDLQRHLRHVDTIFRRVGLE